MWLQSFPISFLYVLTVPALEDFYSDLGYRKATSKEEAYRWKVETAHPLHHVYCSFLMVRDHDRATLKFIPPTEYDEAACREWRRVMQAPHPVSDKGALEAIRKEHGLD